GAGPGRARPGGAAAQGGAGREPVGRGCDAPDGVGRPGVDRRVRVPRAPGPRWSRADVAVGSARAHPAGARGSTGGRVGSGRRAVPAGLRAGLTSAVRAQALTGVGRGNVVTFQLSPNWKCELSPQQDTVPSGTIAQVCTVPGPMWVTPAMPWVDTGVS